ncbi:MAG: ferrous iron transporter B [Candidatus Omnitrophica bacterium]|nr:ferrous iron transporter B [Candidatus Omnitrophota bacterium]
MNKILLIGNPNVGKSALFSRMTGAKVVISNYPGTTVEFCQGFMKLGDATPMIIDAPGTYTLSPTSKAEAVAVRMLDEGGVVINVVDATNLERNLNLTIELLKKDIPMVIALNMWDDTSHRGIEIDVGRLEETLGVPVVPTCALTGEGIKELVQKIPAAKKREKKLEVEGDGWQYVGRIVQEVQRLHHRHHTFLETLADLSIRPLTGFPIAMIILMASFFIVRFVAEGLIGYVFEPFFDYLWTPIVLRLSSFLGQGGVLHGILIGEMSGGKIDYSISFGILTTGLFVPFAMVLPYIISFYLVLGILEDFGYLPRLAVLMDNVMHKLGLHGYSIIPMILGLGCNVPGALATRLLEGRREKFIAATLMAVAVPCMAQIAMIVGLVGQRGGRYVVFIFAVLFIILISKGFLLNKILKGRSPEILLEIPPYRIPHIVAVIKKLRMRIYSFIKEAIPYVLLGILLVNILYSLKVISLLESLFSPILQNVWGLPREAIGALIIGFLRKDVAVGMLGPLNMTTKQLVIGSTVLAIYFPCIATFVVLVRELGLRDMFKSALLMMGTALVVGGILNFLLP